MIINNALKEQIIYVFFWISLWNLVNNLINNLSNKNNRTIIYLIILIITGYVIYYKKTRLKICLKFNKKYIFFYKIFNMNIKNLLNRFVNQDIKDNQDLLDDMCNQNIDNPLCNPNLIKKSTIITNDNLYNDIEVFEDFKNNENTVFNSIDKTYTNGGQFYLKELLNNPLEDFNELLNRKNNLIKIFEKIKSSKNELQKFFIKISENEKKFILDF